METRDVLAIRGGVYLVSLTYYNYYANSQSTVDFKEIFQSCQVSRSTLSFGGNAEFHVEFPTLAKEYKRWVPLSIIAMKSDVKKEMKSEDSKWTVTFDGDNDHGQKWLYMLFNFDSGIKHSVKRRIDRLSNLWQTKFMTDVTISLKGEIIQAHRLILAYGSPVFANMFQNDFKENLSRIVNIEDVEPGVMKHLLRFMYTNDADLENVEVDALLIAADKYAMDSLKVECAHFLKSKLTVRNSVHCLVLSHLYHVPFLRQSVLDYMTIHSQLVSSLKEWMVVIKNYPDLCFMAMQALAKKNTV